MDWQFASPLALLATPHTGILMCNGSSPELRDHWPAAGECELLPNWNIASLLVAGAGGGVVLPNGPSLSISHHSRCIRLAAARRIKEVDGVQIFKMKIEIAAGDPNTIRCWWGGESNIHFKSAPDEWGRVWLCVGVFKTWVIIWQFHHMRHMGITKLFLFHLSLRYMREMNHQKQICRYWDNSRKYLHFIT